jgi:hypothetical protein
MFLRIYPVIWQPSTAWEAFLSKSQNRCTLLNTFMRKRNPMLPSASYCNPLPPSLPIPISGACFPPPPLSGYGISRLCFLKARINVPYQNCWVDVGGIFISHAPTFLPQLKGQLLLRWPSSWSLTYCASCSRGFLCGETWVSSRQKSHATVRFVL